MATGATDQGGLAMTPAGRVAALWQDAEGGGQDPGGGGAVDPPDVFAFLAELGPTSPQERLAVLLVDQRERWRAGLGRPVEVYLAALPDVAADAGAVSELING